MLLFFIQWLVIFIFFISLLLYTGNWYFKGTKYSGNPTDHFTGTHFFSYKQPKIFYKERKRLILKRLAQQKNKWVKRAVPVTKPRERVEGSELVITFINHATVLIQTEGLNIITDPVWSERVSPVKFFGPKRYQNPGVHLSDLPKIDIVLLSHNHYDHLDVWALRTIAQRDTPLVLTHLGISEFLHKKHIGNSVDLDWFDTHKFRPDIVVTSVPAQHFSARALSDRNKTLWGGFVLSTPHGDIYFVGDTGYGPFVERIAERFPQGFRFALIPIGAFSPAQFMSEMHMSPHDAFQFKKELQIKKAVAIHFGTFKLAFDGQDEPVTILEQLTQEFSDDTFVALPNGGVFTL